MDNSFLNGIINALENQQEIFGDFLFEKIDAETSKNEKGKLKEEIKIAEKVELQLDNNIFAEDFQTAESLTELNEKISGCLKCPLGKTRINLVFGAGNPNADVMLIGEAPGADEDKQGIPFVGRAGKLLNDILKSINFKREEIYIANIVKCRPPQNRNPLPNEMEACLPYLYKQIELIKPKMILLLGRVAAIALLKKNMSLSKFRGNIYEISGIKTMVTYHPAALLRNPQWKRPAWEDLQKFRKLYDEITGAAK